MNMVSVLWLEHSLPSESQHEHTTSPTSRWARRPGKYKPFSVIVRDEGGDAEAYKAGVNIVKSCVALTYSGQLLKGEHSWFRVNSMSKRLEWMHLDTTYSDLYTEAHTTTQTRVSESNREPAAVEPLTPSKAAVETGALAGKRKRATEVVEGGGSGKKAPRDGGELPGDDVKKRKKEEQARWTKLMGLRGKMREASGAAKDLRETIMTSDNWAWARNEYSLKELDTATTNIKQKPTLDVFVYNQDFKRRPPTHT